MQTTYWSRFLVWLGLVLVLVGAPRGASADREEALTHWKKGDTAYSLARFEEAIGHFERAFRAHPAPAFTFNIAQCHRQLKNCERAAFFYRRYLSMKPDAANRREVEGFIAQMEAMCARAGDGGETSPAQDREGVGRPPGVRAGPRPGPRAGGSAPPSTRSPAPASGDEGPILTSVAEAGPAFISMGRLDVPAQPSVRLGVAHPIAFGAIGVEPGVLVNFTPIAIEDAATELLTSLLANAAVTYRVAARLRLRAEVGVGVMMFGRLDRDNPFTEGGAPTTGVLTMFNMRGAVGADYFVGDSLVISATPLALAVSPPKQGLDPSIDRIIRLDVLVGVGYRL